MTRSSFFKRFLLIFTIFLGVISVGSTTVAADSNESGSAVVTFNHVVLNPSNPRLPLADTDGEPANNGTSGNGKQTVVVDTTPEKTKVTDTATTKQQHTTLPATSGRTSLPQTGTATMPMMLVMISIAMGLMMGWQVLKNERNLAK